MKLQKFNCLSGYKSKSGLGKKLEILIVFRRVLVW